MKVQRFAFGHISCCVSAQMLCKLCESFDIRSLFNVSIGRRASVSDWDFLDGGPFQNLPKFEFHAGLAELQASADRGCALCTLIWRGFCEDKSSDAVEQLCKRGRGRVFLYLVCEEIGNRRLWVLVPYSLILRLALGQYHIYSARGKALSEPGSELLSEPHLSPASEECLAVAAKWMEQCHSHERCQTVFSAKPMPTRVLDVARPGSEDLVHLIETDHKWGVWAALSYCWGDQLNITATKATLKAKTEGMALRALPATFRDAITVVRRMGLRYIWIDALCILQDDREDWARESGRMKDIYCGSTLTILATNSRNASHGFLNDRIDSPQCRLQWRTKNGRDQTSVSLRPRRYEDGQDELQMIAERPIRPMGFWSMVGQESEDTSHLYQRSITTSPSSPLFSRGWALQEFYLSPRVLSYGENQMKYVCLDRWRLEDGQSGICEEPQMSPRISRQFLQTLMGKHVHQTNRPPVFAPSSPSRPCSTGSLSSASSPRQEDRVSRFYGMFLMKLRNTKFNGNPARKRRKTPLRDSMTYLQWREIIEEYTKRNLTCWTDILPALSGLATVFESELNDLYCAGLWAGDLLSGLTWRPVALRENTRPEQEQQNAPPKYHVPSWSWASAPGVSVEFAPLDRQIEYAQILNVATEPFFDDRFGQTLGGYIDIEAPLNSIGDPTRVKNVAETRLPCLKAWLLRLYISSEVLRAEFDHKHKECANQKFAILLLARHGRLTIDSYPVFIIVESTGHMPSEYRRVGCLNPYMMTLDSHERVKIIDETQHEIELDVPDTPNKRPRTKPTWSIERLRLV